MHCIYELQMGGPQVLRIAVESSLQHRCQGLILMHSKCRSPQAIMKLLQSKFNHVTYVTMTALAYGCNHAGLLQGCTQDCAYLTPRKDMCLVYE